MSEQSRLGDRPSNLEFESTHWSLVLVAGDREASGCAEALELLCRCYWPPLYNYARRKSADVHRAQDLTQAFFTHLLQNNAMAAASPGRGRFRTFLLTAFRNFMVNQWEKETAQKRGGCRAVLSLDFASADHQWAPGPVEHVTPEQIFDRDWALTLLDHVLERLRKEYSREGKEALFQSLKGFLVVGENHSTYQHLAQEWGLSAGAVKMATYRLRRRYRDLIFEQIRQTVASAEEVEDEIRRLFAVFESSSFR